MKRYYFILLVIMCLVCSSLACSLLNLGKDGEEGSPPPTEAISSEQEPTAEFETAPLDEITAFDTSRIKSYRGEITMSFDGVSNGETVKGSVFMTIEMTSEPKASHFIMKMEGDSLGGEEIIPEMEFYIVADKMYTKWGAEGSWMVLPAESEASIDDTFFSFQDISELPPNAQRKLLPESVNGVMCWHYVFDETDFPPEVIEFDRMNANLWISVDDGYMVKMDMTASGTFNQTEGEFQSMDEGTIHIVFDMKDVNQNFTIELPPEAASAEEFDLGGDLLGDMTWKRADVPLPEDAEIAYSYEQMVTAYTLLSVAEARDFMLTQLEGNGWTFNTVIYEEDDSYMADFTKGDETLTLMIDIAEDDGQKTSIFISIE
jgi:hypothetical protein